MYIATRLDKKVEMVGWGQIGLGDLSFRTMIIYGHCLMHPSSSCGMYVLNGRRIRFLLNDFHVGCIWTLFHQRLFNDGAFYQTENDSIKTTFDLVKIATLCR